MEHTLNAAVSSSTWETLKWKDEVFLMANEDIVKIQNSIKYFTFSFLTANTVTNFWVKVFAPKDVSPWTIHD